MGVAVPVGRGGMVGESVAVRIAGGERDCSGSTFSGVGGIVETAVPMAAEGAGVADGLADLSLQAVRLKTPKMSAVKIM
jgi:hypothetical protein